MPPATSLIITIMTTRTITDSALVRLLTWLSPAFPTGAFAYSHGLEWAVQAGDVRDEADLLSWVGDVLVNGSGRTDAILLRHAHRTSDRAALAEIAELASAAASCQERQAESLGQGGAFVAAAEAWGAGLLQSCPERMPYAVAVGAVAALHEVDEDSACLGFLQACAANLVSAAVRLVPLGQTAGLRVLKELEPMILSTAEATREAGLDEIGGCAFRSDLAAMRHETQYTRLFRS
jgi:urease accessory protein